MPSLTPLNPSTAAASTASQPLLPLCDVAGTEGLVNVHVPFSIADLSHISDYIGSFDKDPFQLTKQLKFIFDAYKMTYEDIQIILPPTQKSYLW